MYQNCASIRAEVLPQNVVWHVHVHQQTLTLPAPRVKLKAQWPECSRCLQKLQIFASFDQSSGVAAPLEVAFPQWHQPIQMGLSTKQRLKPGSPICPLRSAPSSILLIKFLAAKVQLKYQIFHQGPSKRGMADRCHRWCASIQTLLQHLTCSSTPTAVTGMLLLVCTALIAQGALKAISRTHFPQNSAQYGCIQGKQMLPSHLFSLQKLVLPGRSTEKNTDNNKAFLSVLSLKEHSLLPNVTPSKPS